MTKLWKLTDQDDQTYGVCQWGEGVEHTAAGSGFLCGSGWIHAYTDPLLAVFLNPIYGDFRDPHLWEAGGDVGRENHGLKVGCTRLKTLCRVDLLEVTPEQRVRFGILCAMRVCENKVWRTWAEKWLSGEDRSRETAREAREAVWSSQPTCRSAAWFVTRAAVCLNQTMSMVYAAAWSAEAVAEAAAGAVGQPLPLAEIAREAVSEGSGKEAPRMS